MATEDEVRIAEMRKAGLSDQAIAAIASTTVEEVRAVDPSLASGDSAPTLGAGCEVTIDSSQAILNGGYISWESISRGADDGYWSADEPERLVFPTGGIWLVVAHIRHTWDANSSAPAYETLQAELNGDDSDGIVAQHAAHVHANALNYSHFQLTLVRAFEANDYLRYRLWAGSAANVIGKIPGEAPRLTANRLA